MAPLSAFPGGSSALWTLVQGCLPLLVAVIPGFSKAWANPGWLTVHGPDIQGVILEVKPARPRIPLIYT
ncbi:Uncharacterized protein DAT39_006976 [Clarias magur]|uniref:Uncharacterized protein n=1 Tax=Clarias magur TaxID=1594786 RepID=A0A8J4URF4_CLAMG|nr:Uncharacterized protein DAT39_006976 [Clarias magur]